MPKHRHHRFVLDFEDAKVSDEEKEIHNTLLVVLSKSASIIDKFRSYQGCEVHIRKAITTPGPETEEAAWKSIIPVVEELKTFYDFSLELESSFPLLLVPLCRNVQSSNPQGNIANQQALAKQFAEVFNFVIRFDSMKMVSPSINTPEFSYYRRILNKMKLSNQKNDINITIRDELANKMSLFFAYPTPMMNTINETTAKFLSQEGSPVTREQVTLILATMANVCSDMVTNKRFSMEDTNMFCLNAMTGSIVLFDHIHPQGAFSAKKSPIRIKDCIRTLLRYDCAIVDNKTNLLNTLRFSTVHLYDPGTPAKIKRLLD